MWILGLIFVFAVVLPVANILEHYMADSERRKNSEISIRNTKARIAAAKTKTISR